MIDDEPFLCATLRISLSERFEVCCAHDVSDALRQLEDASPFAAVLCDVRLPGTSGLDLRTALVARGAPIADRFVFMTGGVTTAATALLLAEGGVPVLQKPFDVETLVATLEAVTAPE